MDELKSKLAKFANELNQLGIPLPMLKDPVTGKASVSLTMLFISFNVVLVGLVGKWSRLLEGIDVDQALNWFIVCASLYFGRSLTKSNKSGDSASLTQQKEEQQK